MLTRVEDLGPGIRRVTVPDLWQSAAAPAAAVLEAFYEQPVPPGYYPHFNEVGLRMALLSAAPALGELRQAVEGELAGGARALVVDRLHLAGRPPAERSRLLYAFCLALGFPTPSNQRQATLLWDVKPRPVLGDRPPTFSEHSDEADLHTDSQSYPTPEELFILYTVRAARCGGGASFFLSVDALEETLAATAEGRDALEALREPAFPFAISVTGEESNPEAVTVGAILGDSPRVRFRRDVVEHGFTVRPDLATPRSTAAVRTLLEVMAKQAPVVTRVLPDDAVAVFDNHAVLHGRAGFTDPERHLVRVRMAKQPLALHIARLLGQSGFFSRAVVG